MKFFSSLLFFAFFTSVSATTHIREFNSNSFNTIINENKHPFILVIWSLECPPCLTELSLLSEVQQKPNSLKLILISTDSDADKTEVNNMLNQFELSSYDNWVFSDEMQQKLRYTIDPNWYGELPRSYFYKNQHTRISRSGALDKATLNSWIKEMSRFKLNSGQIKYDK